MITWNTTDTPKSSSLCDEGNEYFLIRHAKYGAMLAMYIENEWHSNYCCKIIGEVTGWTELNLAT